MRTIVALALFALLAMPVHAQERIRSYDVHIAVAADGSIDVTETITVRAEGAQIRRGIYRDIPTRYRDRFGNRVRVELEVVGVERDGRPEAWFTEGQSNGLRINTGGDDFLPTLPGDYTFAIRYRATRQLGFFNDHDELYWNAIGTGWIFPIESGTVTVRLPAEVPTADMSAEAYTGLQGERGIAYAASLPAPGSAHYRLTAPLDPYEGLTVVLTFPKGIIAEPTDAQRARWFLSDNAGVLVALGGLAVLLLYAAVTWWRVGRDPRRGVIIPRYHPPAEQTPALLRYLRRERYDMRCFSADLLALAVAGHVRIQHEKKRCSSSWQLERVVGQDPSSATVATGVITRPHPIQQQLLDALFPAGAGVLELDNKNATVVAAARDGHSKSLETAINPRYLLRHHRTVWIVTGILVVTAFAAFNAGRGDGTFAIILVLFTMLMVLNQFARLVRAPTAEGRELLDEIEGLRLYLGVAEGDRLARLRAPEPAPALDADHFEALLPHAIALDVEDAWTKKFTAAVGVAAAAEATGRMGWYSGSGRASDLGGFTRAIGSSLSSSIASASTPPGSSSGSGGGGSSGGGGGGGGGGGR
jgi:uncharacterized membrane protein YgcG